MDQNALRASFGRIQNIGVVIGVIGLVICAASYLVVGPKQFFQSYLMGLIFWIQISVGCMFALMVHHLAGGRWGGVIQRVLESAVMVFPALGILFLPMFLGITTIYEWAMPEAIHDPIIQFKSWYLNVPFLFARYVIFFLFWTVLAYFFNKYSLELDETGDIQAKNRLKNISGPGMLFFGLTITFFAFDWMMSLDPHWYSTMYGFTFGVGSGNGAIAVLIIMMSGILIRYEPFSKVVKPLQINDHANFLFGAVMTWGYAVLCQGLITWSGDVSEFTPWYIARTSNGWQFVFITLVFIQFAIPFFFLLFWPVKRNLKWITAIACLVFVARILDIYFLIAPSEIFEHATPYFDWAYLAAIVGVGGIWMAVFSRVFISKPSLVPLNDPKTMFQKELQHGSQQAPSYSH